MIVRVGFLDKDENYIARLANYYSAHANETVQFEIYLFTKEEALRKQLSRGGRMDLLVAEEDLLPEPEEVVQAAAQRQRAVRRQWRHRGKIRSASH